MDRTERLLDLLTLLLDAREPISWAELREVFEEDYGKGSDEAAERKFERDKAELLELGIPITYVQGDDDRKDGYVVQRDAYYLPDAGLSPEELAVLYAAGSAALTSGAFPGRQDLAHALRKVSFSSGAEIPTPRLRMEVSTSSSGADLAQKLEELWSAAAAKKSVDLSYYSPKSGAITQRRVDPYGLALRRGIWTLVGFCHLRSGIRTFHVDRIQTLNVNAARPRSPDFTVPDDFSLDAFVASHPWQHRFHEPLPVTIALEGELAPLAARLFPDSEVVTLPERAEATVSVTYLDGLVRYALSLGPQAKVLQPPLAVERWRQTALKVFSLHQVPRKAAAGERA